MEASSYDESLTKLSSSEHEAPSTSSEKPTNEFKQKKHNCLILLIILVLFLKLFLNVFLYYKEESALM